MSSIELICADSLSSGAELIVSRNSMGLKDYWITLTQTKDIHAGDTQCAITGVTDAMAKDSNGNN